MTIKEKLIYNHFKKIYKKIQTPDTIFTKEWLISTVKETTHELYSIIPDKNFGELSCSCFDSNFKSTVNYGPDVYYVDISFHDRYTKIPWLICRFYKQNAKVRFYLSS